MGLGKGLARGVGERQRRRCRIYLFGDMMDFADVDGAKIVRYRLLSKLNLVIRRGCRLLSLDGFEMDEWQLRCVRIGWGCEGGKWQAL